MPDGTRVVLKGSRQAPGRVTVVSEKGETLMDDYIEVSEVVVDYLTRWAGCVLCDIACVRLPLRGPPLRFSGLTPEDLDPARSKHRMSTLKARTSRNLVGTTVCERHCLFAGSVLQVASPCGQWV